MDFSADSASGDYIICEKLNDSQKQRFKGCLSFAFSSALSSLIIGLLGQTIKIGLSSY